MLSPLSRGYGTWSGRVEYSQPNGPSRENTFPSIGERNLTGISLSASIGTKSSAPTAPLQPPQPPTREPPPQPPTREPSYGEMYLPKTYLTRKGALLLFTAPESKLDDSDFNARWQRQRLYKMRRDRVAKLIDLSLRLGNLTRLSNSVLQYGNQDFDPENASISDEKNKQFLKFLQNLDQKEIDSHAKPGGDLEFYLRDLKSRGSARYVVSGDTYLPKSRISQELQALLHGLDANCPPSFSQEASILGERSYSRLSDQFTRSVSRASSRAQSPGSAPPSTPKSYNVLSCKKLTASIKSSSYLGRPSSTEPLQEDPPVQDAIGVGISPGEEGTDGSGLEGYTSPLTRKLFRMPGTQPSVAGSSIAEEEESLDHLSRTLKERATSPGMPPIYQVTGEESEDEDKVDEVLLERFRRGGSLFSMQSEEVSAQYQDVDIASLISGRTGETDASSKSELSHLTQLAQSIGGKVPKAPGKGKKLMGKKKQQKSSTSLDKTDTVSETTSSVGSKRRDSLKIPEHMKDALTRRPSLSKEELEKEMERMSEMVDATLCGPTLHSIGEGLTEEELKLAKQILQEKLAAAKEKIDDPKGQGKKSKSASSRKSKKKDDKSDIEKEQEAIRERHEREKKNREEEVRALQEKIAERKAMLKQQKDLNEARTKELQEEMDRLQQEADEIQRTEDDVRAQLTEMKRKQREERQARKNEMLEKKKQEIAAKREKERKEAEEKRKKEQEMHEKIADAEMRRRLREEEERNREEEERLAEERYMEEIKEQQRLAEEEEERARELERQAEEEAMQRLIEERNEAERQKRVLMEEKMRMEEESLREQEFELERQRQLEEEERKRLEEEQARKEQEMARIKELRMMEEKAKAEMQIALEQKRTEAILRRDKNLEARQNISQLRYRQAITRAWVFSYFIRWPRETFEQPIGGKPKNKRMPRAKTPKPDSGAQKPP